MAVYLINGPSGSGKTSIGQELKERGLRVIDADEAFGYYANLQTEQAVEFPGNDVTEEWYKQNGWIWNRKKVEEVLDKTSETTFLCGGALNENLFYPRFKKVFRLITDAETLVKRIKSRGSNTHTNNPDFIAKMLKFLQTAKSNGEKAGMVIIDTSHKSVDESTDELLRHVRK
jgi:shikimate kinase